MQDVTGEPAVNEHAAFVGKRLALISVTDKTGLVPFARGLVELGLTLLSTGGTARLLREHGISVSDVAAYTGSAEILDGRVKTLHPKIHGGILFDRSNVSHREQIQRSEITAVELVVVNLYRFVEEAVARQLDASAAIEHIDIGGPTMLRAAAKNWQYVLPVIDPADYEAVLASLKSGQVSSNMRRSLAAKTFRTIAAYDATIANYLLDRGGSDAGNNSTDCEASGAISRQSAVAIEDLGSEVSLNLRLVQSLRYGENPHQQASLYAMSLGKGPSTAGFGCLELLQGKELSYNNILDLDAATALASEFAEPAVVIVKHTNPCGCATHPKLDLASIYRRALACDPKSAFGGIVACNQAVDRSTAEAIAAVFTECIAAPDFSPEALKVFAQKPALRVLRAPFARHEQHPQAYWHMRSVQGALLVQAGDQQFRPEVQWRLVTTQNPTEGQYCDLGFAQRVAKHVKSNAIVLAKDRALIGVGAGQMSRIDAAQLAVRKAINEGHSLAGAVLASDAFFPFRDTVDFAAEHGIAAIVQPGGSKRDQDSIDACNERGMAMLMTDERHFRH